MISVRLSGGLGNQLFQVAAALHLRDVQGRHVVLDRGWFSSAAARAPRRDVEVGGATDGLRIVRVPWRLQRLAPRLGPTRHVDELGPDDDALTRVTSRTVSVQGYFQSARVPLSVTPALTRGLGARLPGIATAVVGERYVAVHCRLGDYVSNSAVRDRHGVSDPQDVLARGAEMAARLGGLAVHVFTDSPTLFTRECGADASTYTIAAADEPWAVLAGLSSARGLVMSNSSMSWWAAFIATQVRQEAIDVAFPTPWYAEASAADSLLRLDAWTATPRRILTGE